MKRYLKQLEENGAFGLSRKCASPLTGSISNGIKNSSPFIGGEQNSMQLCMEYTLQGAHKAYKRLLLCAVWIFTAFRRFSSNSIITVCPDFLEKATGSLLQPLMSSSSQPRSCCSSPKKKGSLDPRLFLPSFLLLQEGRCLPEGKQMQGLWGAFEQHKPSCGSQEEKALHGPIHPWWCL